MATLASARAVLEVVEEALLVEALEVALLVGLDAAHGAVCSFGAHFSMSVPQSMRPPSYIRMRINTTIYLSYILILLSI